MVDRIIFDGYKIIFKTVVNFIISWRIMDVALIHHAIAKEIRRFIGAVLVDDNGLSKRRVDLHYPTSFVMECPWLKTSFHPTVPLYRLLQVSAFYTLASNMHHRLTCFQNNISFI